MRQHRRSTVRRTLVVVATGALLGTWGYAQVPEQLAGAAESAGVSPGGVAGVDWKLNGATSDSGSSNGSGNPGGSAKSGVRHLTFPFTPERGGEGYYWAQQFYFEGGDHIGYTGVQPTGGGRFLFSVFGDGPTTRDEHCSDGADGGSGVSCAVNMKYTAGHTYRLHVDNTGGNTWRGTVEDVGTGKRTPMGSWTVPASWGALKTSGNGFVEHYSEAPSCEEMQRGAAVFGHPSSSDGGEGTATAGEAYGKCLHKTPVGYGTAKNGVRVTTGRP